VEIVTILRALWHRRVLVGLVAALALVVGFMLTFEPSFPPKSRKYEVGIATARILVDTPKSQVVEVTPRGSETLGPRASVIANLMAEGEVKDLIARRAGLKPRELHAAAESAIDPQTVSPAQASEPDANLLTMSVMINPDGVQLPIIKIDAQAPDTAQATKLANAAVAGLRDFLDSKAAAEEISDARRLQVTGLGDAQARVQERGPGRLIALAAMILVFVVGCAAILLSAALARAWRQQAASEDGALEGASNGAGYDGVFDDDEALDLFGPAGGNGSAAEPAELWAELPADALAPPTSASDDESGAGREAKARTA
jgi:capsular polysaccharide biosynthesis protein